MTRPGSSGSPRDAPVPEVLSDIPASPPPFRRVEPTPPPRQHPTPIDRAAPPQRRPDPAPPRPRSCGPRLRRACPRSPSSACPSRSCGRCATQGFTDPFPIQAATLPDALAGRDVLGRGQTGSGKTLAFGLAVLARLAGDRARPRRPRALVLVPTRELAIQVVDALDPVRQGARAVARPSWSAACRSPASPSALRRGVDLLVATPGRLADHLEQGTCSLGDVDDHRPRRGRPHGRHGLPAAGPAHARPDAVRRPAPAVLRHARRRRRRARPRYLTDPVTRSVAPPPGHVATMEHHVLHVDQRRQAPTSSPRSPPARAARSCSSAPSTAPTAWPSSCAGTASTPAALHGGKAQNARTRAIAAFRDGLTPVLVATDVAARGIHVDDVSLVVHVDPPADPKDYLHRAGRTARAGESGTVVTMVTTGQRREVDEMTRQAGVRARSTAVTPGAPDLIGITGARSPSGTALIEPARPRPQQRPKQQRRRGGQEGAGEPARSAAVAELQPPSSARVPTTRPAPPRRPPPRRRRGRGARRGRRAGRR